MIAAYKWFLILWVGSGTITGNISGPYTYQQCTALRVAHARVEAGRGYGEWFKAECRTDS